MPRKAIDWNCGVLGWNDKGKPKPDIFLIGRVARFAIICLQTHRKKGSSQ